MTNPLYRHFRRSQSIRRRKATGNRQRCPKVWKVWAARSAKSKKGKYRKKVNFQQTTQSAQKQQFFHSPQIDHLDRGKTQTAEPVQI